MNWQRIHILGASGSGTSTLGKALATRRNSTFLDTDDYFWKVKYSEIHAVEDRVALLQNEFAKSRQWILSGSLCGWGDVFIPLFDLVVFLYLPRDVRMHRLQAREKERYGDDILPGGPRHAEYSALIEWAGKYDDGGPEIRSKRGHEEWLRKLKCPVLRLEGDISLDEKLRRFEETV